MVFPEQAPHAYFLVEKYVSQTYIAVLGPLINPQAEMKHFILSFSVNVTVLKLPLN